MLILLLASSATPAAGLRNDAITRTFNGLVLAEASIHEGGSGILSPGSPCSFTVSGTTVGIPSLVYYQTDRTATNIAFGYLPWSGLRNRPLGVDCPLPGPSAPLSLAVESMDLHASYDAASVDQLICTAAVNVECFPDGATARATLSLCGLEDSSFIREGHKKGILDHVGSSRLECSGQGFHNAITYYDGGGQGYCQDWFFDASEWGSDCLLQLGDLVAWNDGVDETGYVQAHMKTDALVVDASTATTYTASFEDCDYLLVLDMDASPTSWAEAKLKHWGIPGGFLLQGWYDLSGGHSDCYEESGSAPPTRSAGLHGNPLPEGPITCTVAWNFFSVLDQNLDAGSCTLANGDWVAACRQVLANPYNDPTDPPGQIQDAWFDCLIPGGCSEGQGNAVNLTATRERGNGRVTTTLACDMDVRGAAEVQPATLPHFGVPTPAAQTSTQRVTKGSGDYHCFVEFSIDMVSFPGLHDFAGQGGCIDRV